jgi:hypothetical protein
MWISPQVSMLACLLLAVAVSLSARAEPDPESDAEVTFQNLPNYLSAGLDQAETDIVDGSFELTADVRWRLPDGDDQRDWQQTPLPDSRGVEIEGAEIEIVPIQAVPIQAVPIQVMPWAKPHHF